MDIGIIDGQGGGLGKSLILKLVHEIPENLRIVAMGTNLHAMNNMIKAGAHEGITGEESICTFLKNNKLSCIIGPIGIICVGGINGEITVSIAQTVFSLHCKKYLLPLRKHGFYIPGTILLDLKEIIDEIILDIKKDFK